MSFIIHNCMNLEEAEEYQNALYENFNKVKLVDFPKTSDYGVYVWEVEK